MKRVTILDEKNIEELAAQMSDRIRMQDYSKEQLVVLIEEYVKMNLLEIKYQTRKSVLNMICDAVNYYDIREEINDQLLIAIRGDLEDDLKEYVDEIVGMRHN